MLINNGHSDKPASEHCRFLFKKIKRKQNNNSQHFATVAASLDNKHQICNWFYLSLTVIISAVMMAIGLAYRPEPHGVRVPTNIVTKDRNNNILSLKPTFKLPYTLQFFPVSLKCIKVEIQLKYENTSFSFFKVHGSGGIFFFSLFFITFERVSASDLCFWFWFSEVFLPLLFSLN